MSEVKIRQTGRVLLLSPADRIALMRVPGFEGGSVWVTFGGRLEPGETPRDAALREAAEETGRDDIVIGRELFVRDEARTIDDAETRLTETFFLARLPDEALSRERWTPEEHAKVEATRWWSLDEIAASGETFLPKSLVRLMSEALAERRS